MNGKVLSVQVDVEDGNDIGVGGAAKVNAACERFFESRGIVRQTNPFNTRFKGIKKEAK